MDEAVYCSDPPGIDASVHRFTDGDYTLSDIPELMLIGRTVPDPDGRERIALTAREIGELKTFADANSFDFEEDLITLCLDLHRFASTRPEPEFTFVAVL
ncbi:MAG: hypothetical protein WD382_04710 [Halofilum sp. (in: g-proteobacteria)]